MITNSPQQPEKEQRYGPSKTRERHICVEHTKYSLERTKMVRR